MKPCYRCTGDSFFDKNKCTECHGSGFLTEDEWYDHFIDFYENEIKYHTEEVANYKVSLHNLLEKQKNETK